MTLALRSPSVSAVTASLTVRSVKEFIDYAKKNPAKVEASGAFVVANTPSEFAAHLKRETEFMGGLIRSLNNVPE